MAITILDYVKDFLVAQGDLRDPNTPGPPTGRPYPVWREPRLGAIGVRQKAEPSSVQTNDECVVSIFKATGIPRPPEGAYSRTDAVEFRIRSARPDVGIDLWDHYIRTRFVEANGAMRAGWAMAGNTLSVWVLKAQILRELQRLGSDEQGWTHSAEITLEVYSEM